MVNAFYVKTPQTVYNWQDAEFDNDCDIYCKLVENNTFNYSVPFSDDLSAVHKTKGNLKLVDFNYIVFEKLITLSNT